MVAALLVFAITFPAASQGQAPRDRTVPGTAAVEPSESCRRCGPAGQAARGSRRVRGRGSHTLEGARGLPFKQGCHPRAGWFLQSPGRVRQNDIRTGGRSPAHARRSAGLPDHRVVLLGEGLQGSPAAPAEQYTYVMQGIAATDRALDLKPDYSKR